jgi:hypothetical protein
MCAWVWIMCAGADYFVGGVETSLSCPWLEAVCLFHSCMCTLLSTEVSLHSPTN